MLSLAFDHWLDFLFRDSTEHSVPPEGLIPPATKIPRFEGEATVVKAALLLASVKADDAVHVLVLEK